jgi:predicted cation transporter
MFKLVGWVVGIALFCWATVSAFSIFSELKFLVDGWSWSVGQVPISIKAIVLMIGKYVSGIVGGYREFVERLVQMLHLPSLPQIAYDSIGVIGAVVAVRITTFVVAEEAFDAPLSPKRSVQFVESTVANSFAVALVLSVLFGIDFLYRHFA